MNSAPASTGTGGVKPFRFLADPGDVTDGRSLRDAAQVLGTSRSVVHRWRLSHKPVAGDTTFASNTSGI